MSATGTWRMARPGRAVDVAATSERALAIVRDALAARGMTAARPRRDGALRFSRGSAGLGLIIEWVSEVLPVWLVPGSWRHLSASGLTVRVLADAAGACTLRVDLDRRNATFAVDGRLDEAVRALDVAFASQRVAVTWGQVTDAALEPRR